MFTRLRPGSVGKFNKLWREGYNEERQNVVLSALKCKTNQLGKRNKCSAACSEKKKSI